MKHVVTRKPVAGTEHEHGSHYATRCIDYIMNCSCGAILYEGCHPPGRHSKELTALMIEHRLEALGEVWEDKY